MWLTRRRWLGWATVAGLGRDSLISAARGLRPVGERRPDSTAPASPSIELATRYVAHATVTLLGVPVFSRSGVGEGYIRYRNSPAADGRSVGIEFGAGSFPEKAHGVNKLGLIRESVIETAAGDRVQCEYFGFMTTSQEATVDDARKSFLPVGETLAYSISLGTITRGGVNCRTMRIQLPSRYDWRDRTAIAREVRSAAEVQPPQERTPFESRSDVPPTFLYAVRNAMVNPLGWAEEPFIFNGKYFLLRATRQPDAAVGAELAARNVARSAARVVRLTGTIKAKSGGSRSGFQIWFEMGSEQPLPLRFDYQAKSFLRLSFMSTGPCHWSAGALERLRQNEENS
jgi:hypothetical protein